MTFIFPEPIVLVQWLQEAEKQLRLFLFTDPQGAYKAASAAFDQWHAWFRDYVDRFPISSALLFAGLGALYVSYELGKAPPSPEFDDKVFKALTRIMAAYYEACDALWSLVLAFWSEASRRLRR